MTTTKIFILIILTSLYQSFGQSVYAIIKEKHCEEIIPFAEVLLLKNAITVDKATSDMDGKLIFKNVNPGDYKISTKYVGCFPDTTFIHISPKTDQNLKIEMSCNFIKCYDIALDSNTVDFSSNQLTPIEFISYLKINSSSNVDTKSSIENKILTITGHAKQTWITLKDISFLITIINSNEKSKCVWTDYASVRHEYSISTIGGQAMNLIDSYRHNEVYPYFLNECSTTDEQRIKEIKKWWAKLDK